MERTVSSTSCASLAYGYENIALRAVMFRNSFERRFFETITVLGIPPDRPDGNYKSDFDASQNCP
jgi:hypothetical protein